MLRISFLVGLFLTVHRTVFAGVFADPESIGFVNDDLIRRITAGLRFAWITIPYVDWSFLDLSDSIYFDLFTFSGFLPNNIVAQAKTIESSFSETGHLFETNSNNRDCSSPFASGGIPVNTCMVQANYAFKVQLVQGNYLLLFRAHSVYITTHK